jgi:hypothetical protein
VAQDAGDVLRGRDLGNCLGDGRLELRIARPRVGCALEHDDHRARRHTERRERLIRPRSLQVIKREPARFQRTRQLRRERHCREEQHGPHGNHRVSVTRGKQPDAMKQVQVKLSIYQ